MSTPVEPIVIRLPLDVARCDGLMNTPDGVTSCPSRHECQRWKSLPPRKDADRCVWMIPQVADIAAKRCDAMIPLT